MNEADESNLIPAQMSKAEIWYALEHDTEFFIHFFLGEELIFPVPDFHIEIFNLMIEEGVDLFACAVPRDHAKTTLARLACVWYFLFSPYRFILYASNTVTIAIPSTNAVIDFLECDNFLALNGPIEFYTRQDGKGIYSFMLQNKKCFLRAHGAGMQVRGINMDNQRPELAILDDIEDINNNATPELFQKLKKWFLGPFKKALDKFGHKIIHIGNLTENLSLIAEHCQSKHWHSRVYGCLLADGTPLWPDAWPIEKLQKDFALYLEAGEAGIWFAEMMNMPTAGGAGVIAPEDIFYQPHRTPDECQWTFITIDLAISENTYAHKTVVAVHGFIEDAGVNGVWQIVDYRGYQGIDPINLFWVVIELSKIWNVHVVGIESVAYQASLKFVFEHECLVHNIQNMKFVDLMAVGRKAQRIITWAATIKAKTYAINERDFSITQELLTYRPDKKDNTDDHIDCCAYGPQMWQSYMHLIMQEHLNLPPTKPQGSYEICQN